MSPQYSTHDSTSRSPSPAPCARFHGTKRPALRSIGTGALCAIVGLASSLLAAPNEASATAFGLAPFMPGSVVVSQGGTIFGGTNAGTGVELNGEVDVYPPNANGDMRPEARYTNGSYGPTTMVFDSSGDLWVGNENTSNLFELARAQLGTRDRVPAVTIFAEAGALANPFGMAFDSSGNLWVVSNAWDKVYEYSATELAASGGPTPVTTISDFPSTPIFGDAFDASGDLWVSTVDSVVEFSKVELASPDPAPTRVISSSGGAQLVFDASGDLWMVTGGGRTASAPPAPMRWWSSPRPSSPRRVPLLLPSRLLRPCPVAPPGPCTAPTRWRSTLRVTCGLRTSTTTPQSSSAGASFSVRGRPPLCGPSLAQIPG